jgi:DNA-binding Xre family transcriptional regulator
MHGKLKNRLFVLIRKREIELGRPVTQIELAEKLGFSEQLISRWVHNEVTRFDAEIVEKICAEFDCDLNDLLYLEPVRKD